MIKPFHLAIPVIDLEQATTFYESVLGCSRGREDEHWIDFNLYGHQLVCHLSNAASEQISNLAVSYTHLTLPTIYSV